MKKTVFYLGNILEMKDKSVLFYISKLEKLFPELSFIHLDPTEDIEIHKNQDLIILDTVVGIDQVTIFPDLKSFQLSPRVSPHDYDLPLELGLLRKLGKIKSVKIIGIPVEGNREEILQDLTSILIPISPSGNGKHSSCRDQTP